MCVRFLRCCCATNACVEVPCGPQQRIMPNVVGLQFSAQILLIILAAPLSSVTPTLPYHLHPDYTPAAAAVAAAAAHNIQRQISHHQYAAHHHPHHGTTSYIVPPYSEQYANNYRRFASTWPYQSAEYPGVPLPAAAAAAAAASLTHHHHYPALANTALGPYLGGDSDTLRGYPTDIRRKWSPRLRPISQRRHLTVSSLDRNLWYQKYRSSLSQSQTLPVVYQTTLPNIKNRDLLTSSSQSKSSKIKHSQVLKHHSDYQNQANDLKIETFYSNLTALRPYSTGSVDNLKRTAPDSKFPITFTTFFVGYFF